MRTGCDFFQIQPDMEELTDNAEEIAEEGDSTKDEKKLGRLQFKVRITYHNQHVIILSTRSLDKNVHVKN